MAELMFVPVCGRIMIIILLYVYEVRSLWNFPKKDWTLFKVKIVIWQENRMAKLCSEYAKLLSSSAPSSEKFWALDERLRHDKRSASVCVRMSRSEMPFIILRLLDEGAITADDLDEFSDEMKAYAEFHIKNSFH